MHPVIRILGRAPQLIVIALLSTLVPTLDATAQASDPQPADGTASTPDTGPPARRPRVALVLSGGGARGFAHVGALRALKDLRVPVDMVAGVSMGAVVGGAYAAGRSVEELEAFVRSTDWTNIVADRPARDALAFRRREDDLLLPSRIELGISRSGFQLPPSTAGNAALESALGRLLPEGTGDMPVNQLPLPFRTVASDLLTGELVDLRETPLFMSLRASLSVPGVFSPVRVDQRLLIDGGLVRNLPVDIARAMGAEVVIAVNVGTPLSGESELVSALGVAQQMLNILTEQNVQRSIQELGPRDVLVSPDLDGVSFLNFNAPERAVSAGEQAVHRLTYRFRDLSVSPEAYAAFERSRRAAPGAGDVALPLASVDVQATPHAASAALKAELGLQAGDTATLAQVREAGTRLFGRGDFERVDVAVSEIDGRRAVVVTPVEATWTRSRLRLGLELFSDFEDDNRFTLSALHTLSWLNPWGAELRTLARIGSERDLATQLWQPLAPGSPWFVAPSLQYQNASLDVYEDERRTRRLGYEFGIASLAAGRQLSNWGTVQLGVERRRGHVRDLILGSGSAAIDTDLRETATFAQLQVDTLDSLALPGRGTLIQARLERTRSDADSAGRATSSFLGLQAFRVDNWVGHVYGEWSKSREGLAPLTLGGFLRLTGTPRASLSGRAIVLGRLVMARQIGEMPTGLGGALRTGFSLETGSGYEPGDGLRLSRLRKAGSVFVSIDTRFGPVFLAFGGTRGVGSSMYLFLGPFW